jgi:hypothetical protein
MQAKSLAADPVLRRRHSVPDGVAQTGCPQVHRVTLDTQGARGDRETYCNAKGNSVERGGDLPQPVDFVTNHQLAAFQLGDTQIVCGRMGECVVQFGLKNFVFAFKFNEMRLKSHTKPPL